MNNTATESTAAQRIAEARTFVVPAGARKITCKASGCVVYLYESMGDPAALGFFKNATRAKFRFRFSNEKSRTAYVSNWLNNVASHATRRAKAAADRKAFVHSLAVGDILYSTWGYDQTNCDFYQVTAVAGKSVMIRKIGASQVAGSAYGMGAGAEVVAIKDSFSGPDMRKIVGEGNRVRLASYSSASRWDGRPVGVSFGG